MEILRKLRKQHKLSTLEVSKLIGYSQKSVENHENGTFLPKSDVLAKYAKLYHVPITYLLDQEDKSIILSEEEYKVLFEAEKVISKIRKIHNAKSEKQNIKNINNGIIEGPINAPVIIGDNNQIKE